MVQNIGVLKPKNKPAASKQAHRRIGRASYALMPLIALLAAMMVRKVYVEHLDGGMNSTAALTTEYLSSIQLVLPGCFYLLAMKKILKRDVAAHMVCIPLVLLPAGLARTLGYWFNVWQSSAQTVCLIAIDLCLIALIVADTRQRQKAGPYVVALLAYARLGTVWLALGRPRLKAVQYPLGWPSPTIFGHLKAC